MQHNYHKVNEIIQTKHTHLVRYSETYCIQEVHTINSLQQQNCCKAAYNSLNHMKILRSNLVYNTSSMYNIPQYLHTTTISSIRSVGNESLGKGELAQEIQIVRQISLPMKTTTQITIIQHQAATNLPAHVERIIVQLILVLLIPLAYGLPGGTQSPTAI